MNSGKAYAIFKHIESDQWMENEKLVAIKTVLDMPTHNGITKDEFLRALKWFYDLAVEEE